MIALFRHHYPGEWTNIAYPTSDGLIPWKEFWMLVADLGAVLAHEALIRKLDAPDLDRLVH